MKPKKNTQQPTNCSTWAEDIDLPATGKGHKALPQRCLFQLSRKSSHPKVIRGPPEGMHPTSTRWLVQGKVDPWVIVHQIRKVGLVGAVGLGISRRFLERDVHLHLITFRTSTGTLRFGFLAVSAHICQLNLVLLRTLKSFNWFHFLLIDFQLKFSNFSLRLAEFSFLFLFRSFNFWSLNWSFNQIFRLVVEELHKTSFLRWVSTTNNHVSSLFMAWHCFSRSRDWWLPLTSLLYKS